MYYSQFKISRETKNVILTPAVVHSIAPVINSGVIRTYLHTSFIKYSLVEFVFRVLYFDFTKIKVTF